MLDLHADARAKIERYLGRVEEHLAGLPDEEREEILRDVDAHVRDALARRAPAGAHVEDVITVLDELDPPASWATSPPAKSQAPSAPGPVAAPEGRDLTLPALTFAAILALFLGFAAAWIDGPKAGGAPGFALLTSALLAAAAGVVTSIRWSVRLATAPTGTVRDAGSAASFALLMVALGLGVVALVAAVSADHLGWEFEANAIRRLYETLQVSALVCGSLAFLAAWILGRVALSGTRKGPALTGFGRARALLAPGIGASALLLGIFVFLPLVVLALGQERWFRRYTTRIENAASIGIAAGLLVGLLVGFGLVLRFAPGWIHAVFSPVTDRLEPHRGRWFLIVAGILLALGVAFEVIHLLATA